MAAGEGVNASVNVSSVNTIKPNTVSNVGSTPSATTPPPGFVGPYISESEMDFTGITTEGLEEVENYKTSTVEPKSYTLIRDNLESDFNNWVKEHPNEAYKGTTSYAILNPIINNIDSSFRRSKNRINYLLDTFNKWNKILEKSNKDNTALWIPTLASAYLSGVTTKAEEVWGEVKSLGYTLLYGTIDERKATREDTGSTFMSGLWKGTKGIFKGILEIPFAGGVLIDSFINHSTDEEFNNFFSYMSKITDDILNTALPDDLVIQALDSDTIIDSEGNEMTYKEFIEKYSNLGPNLKNSIESVGEQTPSLILSLIIMGAWKSELGKECLESVESLLNKTTTFSTVYTKVFGKLKGQYLNQGYSEEEATKRAMIDATKEALIEALSGGIGGTESDYIFTAVLGETGEELIGYLLDPLTDLLKEKSVKDISLGEIEEVYLEFFSNPEKMGKEMGDITVATALTTILMNGVTRTGEFTQLNEVNTMEQNNIETTNIEEFQEQLEEQFEQNSNFHIDEKGLELIQDAKDAITNQQNVQNIETETLQAILENAEFNKTNLVNGIIDTLPANLDDATKARMIYLKLNQVFTYSDEFLALTNQPPAMRENDKIAAYINSNIDITNITRNSIVCIEWAQIYAELLEKAGLPKDSIHIYGEGTNGHQFVTVELSDGNILFADGTISCGEVSDMVLAKFGEQTNNFKIYDKNHAAMFADYVLAIDPLIYAENRFYRTEESISLEKIDKKIGYNTEDYESDFKTITSNYSNQEVSLNNRIDGFLKIMNSDNYSTSDMFNISRSYKDTFFPQNQCKYISSTLYITSNNDAINVISITDQNGKKSYIYKINTGDAIYTDNIDGIIPIGSTKLASWL